MRAPVQGLVRQARQLLEDYQWVSPAVLQRRLRVTAKMARYLCEEVGGPKVPPHWLRELPALHR